MAVRDAGLSAIVHIFFCAVRCQPLVFLMGTGWIVGRHSDVTFVLPLFVTHGDAQRDLWVLLGF